MLETMVYNIIGNHVDISNSQYTITKMMPNLTITNLKAVKSADVDKKQAKSVSSRCLRYRLCYTRHVSESVFFRLFSVFALIMHG